MATPVWPWCFFIHTIPIICSSSSPSRKLLGAPLDGSDLQLRPISSHAFGRRGEHGKRIRTSLLTIAKPSGHPKAAYARLEVAEMNLESKHTISPSGNELSSIQEVERGDGDLTGVGADQDFSQPWLGLGMTLCRSMEH